MGRLKSNFIYDAIYQLLILVIPFITTPYIARTIGAEGVGIYSYTYSIVNYFMMFALLGMNTYGNREISKVLDKRDILNKTFSSIYLLQISITIIVSIIYLIYVLNFENKYFSIQIIQSIYLISVAFDINWLFCGLQKFKLTVTRSAFIKIITLALILIFVKNENDLWKYTLILSVTTLFNQIVLWPFLKKEVKFVKVELKEVLKHLKPTLVLFIPVIAMSVYRVMDKIMIGKMVEVTQVGYYENAEKMLNIVLSVVGALGTVTLPEMTYLYNKGKKEEFYKIFRKSIEFIIFIVLPVIFGFLATADDLVYIYLGEKFIQSATLLKILCFSLLFSPLAGIIRMQLLIPRNKDMEYIVAVIFGAIVDFLLNLILIKFYGAVGASIATVIAEFVVLALQYIYVKNEIKLKFITKSIFKFAISALAMYIVVFFIGKYIEKVIVRLTIQIIIGILIYFGCNIKYINDMLNIKKIVKERKKSATE